MKANSPKRKGVKSSMYDENGNLIAAWKSLNPSVDISPPLVKADAAALSLDGQKRKELNEVMKDRTLSREERAWRIDEIKKMYSTPSDDAASKSDRLMGRDNANLDVSTQGNLKKKQAELDALKKTSTGRKGVKSSMYDEHGNLKAWGSLKEKDESAEQNGSNMNVSAEGMKAKQVRDTKPFVCLLGMI